MPSSRCARHARWQWPRRAGRARSPVLSGPPRSPGAIEAKTGPAKPDQQPPDQVAYRISARTAVRQRPVVGTLPPAGPAGLDFGQADAVGKSAFSPARLATTGSPVRASRSDQGVECHRTSTSGEESRNDRRRQGLPGHSARRRHHYRVALDDLDADLLRSVAMPGAAIYFLMIKAWMPEWTRTQALLTTGNHSI